MSRGINKVILIGNLGVAPEMRYMPSGDPVANLRIATSEGWRDKSSGKFQERTEWHTIIMYGKLADVAGKFLKKGSKIYIEGRMRTEKWQTRDGQDRYATKVIADVMQMLDSRGDTSSSNTSFSESNRQSGTTNQEGRREPQTTNKDNLGFEDDIPF